MRLKSIIKGAFSQITFRLPKGRNSAIFGLKYDRKGPKITICYRKSVFLEGYMEYSAITHVADKRYCYALDKDYFLIRIKTKKGDIKKVTLHYQDKYLPIHIYDSRQQVEMELVCFDQFCDYYEVRIQFHVVCLRYFFELEDHNGEISYFGNLRFYKEKIEDIDRMFDCPQNLREEEILTVPEWAKNSVVYQIFPTRFATTCDVKEEEWYQAPISGMANLKGNLRGVIEKLDYLKDLGVDVLYFNPIFRSDSCHKYDTYDYYQVDPSFGRKEDLKELVQKAHDREMKVILDGVFNHTSQRFFAFADIIEKQEKSEYLDWYFIEGFPLQMEWGKKPNFKCFSYFGGMPKLNLKNPVVEEYFINVGTYWIKECGIDGWRFDVGDEISHRFWKKFAKRIKAEKPDALLVGEIWHYAADFLEGDEWDSVMNYDFFNNVVDYVARNTITASEFMENLGFMRGNLHVKTFEVLWNHLDTHDTARFLHIAGEDKKKQKLAAAFQLLMPGMPMIYYGDEYGITGGNDPDCRRGMLWDEKYQDKEVYEHYKALISIRHQYPEILEQNLTAYVVDDEKELITLETKNLVILFHRGESDICLSNYEGLIDQLTKTAFDGTMKPYEVKALIKEGL